MAIAAVGVTTSFTLNPTTSTALATANPGRRYILITNNDKTNSVAIAHGTLNSATVNHHLIPPGGVLELGPFEPTWGWNLDIAAIAVSGNPTIAYTEN